ncbi:hypothetical protein SASPL_157640 [Salvia splendens]|uniref:Uncharacterized protein n=1 Tax=Salvia splendens TaxID=180675 RepID=A0A8X8VUJ3_SALSN|nr:hypothetical protein SASPL_157640 [Salvia splendens]
MSARNRGPPIPSKGFHTVGCPIMPQSSNHIFPRGILGPPHPALHEERLAATHVALKQELEVTQYELQRADKQELAAQVQVMTQDLGRVTSDLHQVRQDIVVFSTAAIEHEKKSFAESFDMGSDGDKLVTRPVSWKKLRAEMANTEKRAPAAAPVGISGVGYNANYVIPNPGSWKSVSCWIWHDAYKLNAPSKHLLVEKAILLMALELVLGGLMIHNELKDPNKLVHRHGFRPWHENFASNESDMLHRWKFCVMKAMELRYRWQMRFLRGSHLP